MAKGGSSGSGKVEYPTYMQTQHEEWLDDAESLINSILTNFLSPYDGELAYNPEPQLLNMEDRIESLDNNIGGLDAISKWEEYINVVLANRDTIYPSIDSTIQTMDTYSQGEATTYIDNILSGNDWEDVVNRVKSELIDIKNDAIVDASNVYNDTNKKMLDQILNDDNALNGMVKLKIGDMIFDAVNNMYSSNLDSLVDEDVKAFEDSSTPEFMRGVSRLAASMVDIGAIHNSAFTTGVALLESDLQKRLASRRSEVKERFVGIGLSQYMQAYTQFLLEYTKSLMSNSTGLYANIYDSSIKNSSAFLNSNVNSIFQKLDGEIRNKIALYAESYRNYISAYMSDEKSKSIYTIESINQLSKLLSVGFSTDRDVTNMVVDLYKNWIVAKKEQVDKDLDIDVLDMQFPFNALQSAGNVLASIAGAASTVNRPMSTAQSAISGAASGAAAGSMLGPYGALIGGGLGLIGGLL